MAARINTANTHRVTAFASAYLTAFADATQDPTMALQQVRLLLALAVHGTLNQADLEVHTGVKKSSNGRNIDRLGAGTYKEAGLGLLESFVDPMDRRYKLVRLAPTGQAVITQAAQAVAAAFGE